ncbi:DivIVA domain-containing protein [Nonomuraea sp. NPDC050786]|uniref:DivIVA domain-containing protein n=1 Tax=Nonomuraea sp. NPDC050786 TaxID=3154840 RepID=UPI0033C599FA
MHVKHEEHDHRLQLPFSHAVGDDSGALPVHAAGPGQLALLTPAAVHHQVFTVVRLRAGYDLAEVDAFLASVETTLGLLWQDNAHLRERLASIPVPPSPSDALAEAERAGRETVESARQEARQIIAEARAEAQRLRREAAAAAEALTRTARLAYREAVEEQLDQFDAALSHHGRQLQDSLRAQLGRLRGALEDPAPPGAVAPGAIAPGAVTSGAAASGPAMSGPGAHSGGGPHAGSVAHTGDGLRGGRVAQTDADAHTGPVAHADADAHTGPVARIVDGARPGDGLHGGVVVHGGHGARTGPVAAP